MKFFFPLRLGGVTCNKEYSISLHMKTNLIELMCVGLRIILVHRHGGKEKIVEKRGKIKERIEVGN